SYARAAFELAPEQPETLAQLEEASGLARDWAPFVEAVSAQLSLLSPAAGGRADEREPEDASGKKRRNRRGKRRRKDADDQREAALPSEPAPLFDPAVRRLEMKLAQVYDEQLSRTDD